MRAQLTRNRSERSPFLDHLSQSWSACFQFPVETASWIGRILRSLTVRSDMVVWLAKPPSERKDSRRKGDEMNITTELQVGKFINIRRGSEMGG